MSTLYYGEADAGGGGVLLTRLECLGYDREPMYNGPDYLCTIHRLRVRGIYNPEVNAYDFPNGDIPGAAIPAAALRPTSVIATGRGNTRDSPLAGILALTGNPGGTSAIPPAQARGSMASTTDRAIRHYLMQPRKRLVYAIGPSPLLVSPGLNADGTAAQRDVYNGPMPLACDVVCVSGTKSFQVDYAIETYVNEALLYRNPNSVILSHRWKRSEDIDQDMYSTITTEGAAVFRTDRLAFLGRSADDFRIALFHPVAPGFARRAWRIEVTEDGSQLRYVLMDKKMHLRVAAPGVTRIEAFATAEIVGTKPMAQIAAAMGGLSKGVNVGSAMSMIGSFIPMLNIQITVRVWGNDRTERKQLEAVAIKFIQTRLGRMMVDLKGDEIGDAATRRALAGSTMSVTHDLNGTFVEVVLECATSGPNQAIVAFQGDGPLAADVKFPDSGLLFPSNWTDGSPGDATPGVLVFDVAMANDLYNDPVGAVDAISKNRLGTRAGMLLSLSAAALLGQDATPQFPVAAMNPAVATNPP